MKTVVIYTWIGMGLILLFCHPKGGQAELPTKEENRILFDSVMNRMHISPGMWRPLFKSQQIFWI